MKKSLLFFSAALLFATSGFAQTAAKVSSVQLGSLRARSMKMAPEPVFNFKNKPHRTKDNGVYYSRPVGTMYSTYGLDGNGSYSPIVQVPPFYDIIFQNNSTASGTVSWSAHNTALADSLYTSDGSLDYGSLGTYSGYYYYAPTISIGGTTFTVGEETSYFSTYPSGVMIDSVGAKTWADPHAGGYGFYKKNSNKYLFGPGTITLSDGSTVTSKGVYQIYEKPATPLYVDSVFIPFYSKTSTPIKTGATLNMYIYEVTDDGDLGDIIDTLTAKASDVINLEDVSAYYGTSGAYGQYGINYYGNICFSKKTTDAFNVTSASPFTINKKFAVMLNQFDDATDFDFGMLESVQLDGDPLTDYGVGFYQDSEGNLTPYGWTGAILEVNFQGVFDQVLVPALNSDGADAANMYRDLTAPDAGGDVYITASGTEQTAPWVYTAFCWYDPDGNENYTIDTDADWISLKSVDQSNYSEYAANSFTLEAEALPSGVSGRSAVVRIAGRGVESEPFVVNQGDATVTGITTVTTKDKLTSDSTIYNLAGQKVGKSYKGVVVKNGEKYIQK